MFLQQALSAVEGDNDEASAAVHGTEAQTTARLKKSINSKNLTNVIAPKLSQNMRSLYFMKLQKKSCYHTTLKIPIHCISGSTGNMREVTEINLKKLLSSFLETPGLGLGVLDLSYRKILTEAAMGASSSNIANGLLDEVCDCSVVFCVAGRPLHLRGATVTV